MTDSQFNATNRRFDRIEEMLANLGASEEQDNIRFVEDRLTRTIHGDRDLAPGRRHRNRTRSRTTGNEQWAAAGTSQPRVAG